MPTLYGPYHATLSDWHDGDTCHLDIDMGFAIHLQGQPSCRIFGINAPELATDAGKAALAWAQATVPAGTQVLVTSHGWDKYGGRFDGSITLPNGTDYAALILAAGHAVPMAG